MTDHDTGYKLLFSHAAMVRDLLEGFMPGDWIQRLDWHSLEKMNGSYVSDDLRTRHDDAIWRIRWGRDWIHLYLLLEFQSSVDRFMPVRVHTYTGLLYQDLIRRKRLEDSHQKLPFILPVVLYNGEPRWRAPIHVRNLILPGPAEFAGLQPEQAFLLLDQGAFDLDQLASMRNLVAALFRLEQHRTFAEVPEVLNDLIDWLRPPELAGLRHSFVAWLRRRLPQWMPGVTIPQLLDLQEIQEMTRNSAQEWKDMHHQVGLREGLEQGLAQGIERGVEQGSTAEARNILLRQLRRRFGEVPAEIETRLNGASREQLEDWIDRVYEVETVAAVFD
ncbi:Rpn family recombination-promoting nuclease/putative transposase [Alloalcanivorax xenomutans]|uniref:Rpn family recombination-promoting nuclease/putative transposase n=2 Tax=Alloalcanivorax xenomutans TaxID=1094342 RepID=A0A9Q3W5J3_9GAMM|nr:Rpn family recombination-promoting nuclease/putative transposase [Alloalcanivorax xenomutans]MCE7508463.1 Rpn family recombination-promoting nuclease/putative transposase [Alloalcanivorax xenomutans]MCE7521822.1 Rpn family recombination-promoting nuclease/putative transposase [Alloalcanivorax xenomutans]